LADGDYYISERKYIEYMHKTSFHILRVGLAITFLWIGILIIKDPEAWGGYLQPWAASLLPIPIKEVMIGTGVVDIAIGFLFLIDSFIWIVALVGAIHLIIVLTTSGINEGTVRDIGILSGVIALMADSLPATFVKKIKSWQKENKM